MEGKGSFSSSVSLIRHEAGGQIGFYSISAPSSYFLNYPPQGRSLRRINRNKYIGGNAYELSTLNGQYTISSLIAEIHEISKKRSLYILAIDGRGGSGKSTRCPYQAECPGSVAVLIWMIFICRHRKGFNLPPSQKPIRGGL